MLFVLSAGGLRWRPGTVGPQLVPRHEHWRQLRRIRLQLQITCSTFVVKIHLIKMYNN